MNYGEIVKRIRKNLGLTQKELADKAGLTQQSISNLEKGYAKEPSLDFVMKIVTRCGVNANMFFYEDEKIMFTPAGSNKDEVTVLKEKLARYEALVEEMMEIKNGKAKMVEVPSTKKLKAG